MTVRIPQAKLLGLARAALEKSGASAEQAQAVADVLVWSDLVGRASQGVWRLPILSQRLLQGGICGSARPVFEQLGAAVGTVHGGGGSGHYVARLAMQHAILMARSHGMGAVAAPDSNYLGAAAYYVNLAAAAGMIGIAASNSFPKVLAHGGRSPALGTNPFAFGAPRRSGEALLIDMATSSAAGSTIRRSAEAGAKLDEAVAVDSAGRPTSNPAAAGALLPLGGAKGYALAVMVEILCGVLAGAGIASGVRSMYEAPGSPGSNGHFMLAVDVARFMPLEAFYERAEILFDWLESTGAPGAVLIPGAARWRALRENSERGIALEAATAGALRSLCGSLRLEVPEELIAEPALA